MELNRTGLAFTSAVSWKINWGQICIGAGLLLVTVLAWWYLLHLARGMESTSTMDAMGPIARPWGATDLGFTFVMWTVMMVGMMLPSAAPMVMVFATIHRKRGERGESYAPTGLFVLGYLIAWTGFSAAATLTQWGLQAVVLLSPMGIGTSPWLGASLLIVAGMYQWTPLKFACLAKCRSPLGFLITEWRDGAHGALLMGLRHGVFCTGCCWALMVLLFVGGVMNLLWVAVIAGFVFVEKMIPAGELVAKLTGVALAGAGVWMMVSAVN